MTRQEMFSKAVRGLAKQGWVRAYDNSICVYAKTLPTGEVQRCAWGYVDPENTSCLKEGTVGGVDSLKAQGIGIAGNLSPEDLAFAQRLQAAHDMAKDSTLKQSMWWFCKHESGSSLLYWPGDIPRPEDV